MEAIGPVEIEAGPIRLRPWREDDADAVLAAQQDPDIRMWAGGRIAAVRRPGAGAQQPQPAPAGAVSGSTSGRE